jgi:hypothetical protein
MKNARLDALGWRHRKAGPVGSMAITGKDDFEAEARSSMRQFDKELRMILALG